MKKILLLIILSLNVACTNMMFWKSNLANLNEEQREREVINRYENLENKYFVILEDELKIKDLENLENKFFELKKDLDKINSNTVSKEHSSFLTIYKEKINLKIQYLKDLK